MNKDTVGKKKSHAFQVLLAIVITGLIFVVLNFGIPIKVLVLLVFSLILTFSTVFVCVWCLRILEEKRIIELSKKEHDIETIGVRDGGTKAKESIKPEKSVGSNETVRLLDEKASKQTSISNLTLGRQETTEKLTKQTSFSNLTLSAKGGTESVAKETSISDVTLVAKGSGDGVKGQLSRSTVGDRELCKVQPWRVPRESSTDSSVYSTIAKHYALR